MAYSTEGQPHQEFNVTEDIEWQNDESWFIVFTPAFKLTWWNWVLKPQFRHVFAYRQSGDSVIVAHRFYGGSYIDVRSNSSVDAFTGYLVENTDFPILEVKSQPYPSTLRLHGLFTCVTFVKSLLFINGFSITPYQLFKLLVSKHNARKVN